MKHALAIFAKTPVPGNVKTRLTPPLSLEQGCELYRCMLLDTITRARSLSLDTVIFYQGDAAYFEEIAPGVRLIPQLETELGGRLEDAFDRLRALGYAGVAVIGSDAPDLPLSSITAAFAQMEKGKQVVFGPAEDGGYYLVALRSACGELFTDIPWSGPEVLERSLQKAHAAGLSVGLLPMWYDVDSFDDLFRPGLTNPENGAPLTRDFINSLGILIRQAAGAL
jgi:uncharacterized protein